MSNKEFARELEKRTRKFAVKIIRLSTDLPNTPEGRVVKYQITKSGTSVGRTIGRPIDQEAGGTLSTRLRFVKAKPARLNIGFS